MLFLKNSIATLFVVAFFYAIELEPKTLLDGQITILLPKDWRPMSESLIKIKYPGARPPQYVYSDISGGISLAITATDSRATPQQLEQYKSVLKAQLEQAYPDATWEGDGMKMVNGKKLGYFKLMTDAADTRIYNQMFFTDMKGKLLLMSFNCVENKLKPWRPVADSIMNSLVVRE